MVDRIVRPEALANGETAVVYDWLGAEGARAKTRHPQAGARAPTTTRSKRTNPTRQRGYAQRRHRVGEHRTEAGGDSAKGGEATPKSVTRDGSQRAETETAC